MSKRPSAVTVWRMCAVVCTSLVLSSTWAGAQSGSPAASPPHAKTTTGVVEGARRGTVDVFLGVPYAQPPVGSLRWRAPQPLRRWNGVRAAKSFGASCFQPWPAPLFGPYTREYLDTPAPSEDCLYLNVWTPIARTGLLPMLVWVHGGGFLGGSGAVPIYDGAHLAAQGVVVVTINYRLGPFGFLAHPGLAAETGGGRSSNVGLQDIIAALDWVKHNAAAFGGDANAVTLAGQSAGAVAVNDLLVSPLARGLFRRAIAQSGSGLGIGAPSLADAERDGERFAQQLGVSNVAGLRALPADRIQSAVVMPFAPREAGTSPPVQFRPYVDAAVLPVDPGDGGSRSQSEVPLLTGFDADEFMPFAPLSVAEFEKMVNARFGPLAGRLLALYPHATDAQADASARLLQRDVYMTSLTLWAGRRAQQHGQDIYAYYYEHPSPVPAGPSWGTFHSSEIPYVFGVLDRAARPYTADDERIAAQLQARWLAFIRSGDPNAPGLPNWPRVAPGAVSIMGIGDIVGPRAVVSTPERFETLRQFVADGGRLSVM